MVVLLQVKGCLELIRSWRPSPRWGELAVKLTEGELGYIRKLPLSCLATTAPFREGCHVPLTISAVSGTWSDIR